MDGSGMWYNRLVFVPLLIVIIRNCMVMCQSTTTYRTSTSRARPSTSTMPQVWSKQDIPDPQIDVNQCGRDGKSSWVCDPNKILTKAEADRIDAVITDIQRSTGGCQCLEKKDCPRDPSYGGYWPAVAVLSKLRLRPGATSEMKREVADDYADYLRDDYWEYGQCNDDLVILVSQADRIVYTKSGDAITHLLTDSCVDKIWNENKQIFSDGKFGEGLVRLLEEYRDVLRKDRDCSGLSNTGKIALIVTAVAAVIGIITCGVCSKRCKGGSGGGGGGSHSAHYSPHHDHHHHSSGGGGSDKDSQSSGGGGGEF